MIDTAAPSEPVYPALPDLSSLRDGRLLWAVITFLPTLPGTCDSALGLPIHQQSDWRCDTGMCLAGWICTLTGATWFQDDPSQRAAAYVLADKDDWPGYVTTGSEVLGLDCPADRREERLIHAQHRARRLLGFEPSITRGTHPLFRGDHSLEDITELAVEQFGPNPYSKDI